MLSWTVKRSFSSSWNILGAFPTLKSVVIYHVLINRSKRHTSWLNSIYPPQMYLLMVELTLQQKHSGQLHKNGKQLIQEIHSCFKSMEIQTLCIWPTSEQLIILVLSLQQMLHLDMLVAQDNKMKMIMSSTNCMYLC